MKKSFLIGLLIVISHSLSAQTAGILYQYLGKSKADIKKQLSALELVRDWGPGQSMDYEEPGPNMLKFRFDGNDICISVNFMSFDPEVDRIKSEIDNAIKEGWKLRQEWDSGNFYNYSFEKGDKILRARNSGDQVFEIGFPGACNWADEPTK